MKKLKVKVFVIIFSLLTLFSLGVLIFNVVSVYTREQSNIENVFNRNRRMFPPVDDRFKIDNKDNKETKEVKSTVRQIFIDFNVYEIKLDENGNYVGLANDEAFYEDSELEKIKGIATKIISEHKTDKYLSNILFDNYSYSFNGSSLTIVDNTKQTATMRSYLVSSLLMFLVIEAIAYLLAKFLTRWIVTPVNESFEREKRFIADASHELKTPLAVIMASADAYTNDKDIKWIDNIKSESDRMNKLVKDLLDLNRLENDSELEKKEENLSKLIDKSILTYESLFFENNIKLESDIKDNILFKCNSDSIKELLSILIDNAIKYSDKKGIVKVNLYKDKDIVLEVINKGIPIKEEDREKIFERFYKVDKSRNRKSNNYGLGLSIAKKIVELHDGKIEAYSKDGFTTFKINFNQK